MDQGLVNGPFGRCKNPIVKTKVLDVQIQMLDFSDFKIWMHVRVISKSDARKSLLGH